jgi:hypothetical protein
MKTIAGIWWSSADLLRIVEEIKHSVPDDEFFCDPAYKPIREAWVASKFAIARPYDRDWELFAVPEKEQFPDLKFRDASNKHDVRIFEVAEADREGRKRCDEYRRAKGQEDTLEFYDPAEEERIAPDEILRVIKQKAQKQYRPKPNLLVYVNLSGGEPTSLYAAGIGHLYGESFESIWLLWVGGKYRLWPNPKKIKQEKLG